MPRTDYQRLLPKLETVRLAFGEVLYEPTDEIRHVYFPGDCLVSLLTVIDRRLALEVGLVGREGMVGTAFALGSGASPVRALVQAAGTAVRMEAAAFRKELRLSSTLQRELHLHNDALLAQFAQTAACNRFHVVAARLARRLLMARDRLGSDQFRLTHEFLGSRAWCAAGRRHEGRPCAKEEEAHRLQPREHRNPERARPRGCGVLVLPDLQGPQRKGMSQKKGPAAGLPPPGPDYRRQSGR